MEGVNVAYLLGLAEGVSLRYTPSGLAILQFVLKGGNWALRVTAYGERAEAIADQLRSGRGVFVEARLVGYAWTRDNIRETDVELRARRILLAEAEPHFQANGVFITGPLLHNAQPLRGSAGMRLFVGVPLKNEEGMAALEVVASGPLGDKVGGLKKGQHVLVVGRLLRPKVLDPDGHERYIHRLEARDVLLMEGQASPLETQDEEMQF